MLNVVLGWQASTFHGWGVYGLNLALHWAGRPDIYAASARPFMPDMVAVDALKARRLQPFRQATNELGEVLTRSGGGPGDQRTLNAVVLEPVGRNFDRLKTLSGAALVGKPRVAVAFVESATLTPTAIENAKAYRLVVAGSTWNERLLRAHGVENTLTILQGIDPTLFHPAPPSGFYSDRFLVFSGGKLESRKGQDIALKAFARFAERRPDAMLVTAWQSPWPGMADGLPEHGHVGPLVRDDAGRVDLAAWAEANGVPRAQFLNLGSVPNPQLPAILREMDVAIFPNRCEGGTNLVAMEAMACGLPTILSANTGHLDLIEGENCFPLTQQGGVEGHGGFAGIEGWGESDVAEAVELLERCYRDRAEARRRGALGARKLQSMTWAKCAERLEAALRDLSP